MKFEFSWQIFEKHSFIKFYESPSSRSWIVPYGKNGHTDWQTDMLKLIVAFRSFAKEPNIEKQLGASNVPDFKSFGMLSLDVSLWPFLN